MATEATGQHQNFTDRGQGMWAVLRDHYEADPGLDAADTATLEDQLATRYPRLADEYREYMAGLEAVSAENIANLIIEDRRTSLAQSMAIALVEGQWETFEAQLGDYRSLDTVLEATETALGTELSDLLAVVEAGNRIPIGPDHLNRALRGGMLPGHNALFFGRPEIGKSLALCALITAARAGYRVGYWENEDPLVSTQLRAVMAICEATEEQVRVHQERYRPLLAEAGYYDRMFFRESPDGTIAEIEAWVEDNDLDLVIINQMVNLRTDADNRVLELSTIARGQRALAKRQECAVIGVAQAGESAIGRSDLRLADLEWSNTGVQATLDLMVGIGANEDMLFTGQRMLSLCKNKLGGVHDFLPVSFSETRSLIS